MNIGVDKKNKKSIIGAKAFEINSFLDSYYMLIILMIFVALIVVGGIFLLYPKYQEYNEKVVEILEEIKEEELAIRKYKKSLNEYSDKYNNVDAEDKIKVKNMIGAATKYPSLYKAELYNNTSSFLSDHKYLWEKIEISEPAISLKKIVSRKNVKTTEEDPFPEGIQFMTVSIELIDTDYVRVKEFIDLLEKNLRLIDILNVSCDENIETCSIEYNTYFFEYKQI